MFFWWPNSLRLFARWESGQTAFHSWSTYVSMHQLSMGSALFFPVITSHKMGCKWKQSSPTCTDWFPDKGEIQHLAASTVCSPRFQRWSNDDGGAFNDLRRLPAVGSSAWLHIISVLGPTAGLAFPQWGCFHQLCVYPSALAHPSACTGSLFSLPALLRGLRSTESRNPSDLCVCVHAVLFYSFSPHWVVPAKGPKWSQSSCLNRLKELVLWGQCVNTCVWAYRRCSCAYLII